jgi:hypothetical protein
MRRGFHHPEIDGDADLKVSARPARFGTLPGMHGPVRLGIDIGAAHTAAVIALPGGPWLPLMPDGAPTLPSGVFIDPSTGALVVGEPGQAAAVTHPDCYLTDPVAAFAGNATTVQVADRDIEVVELVAAVLRRVATEAQTLSGRPPSGVDIAVPASWGPRRRERLQQAVARAGLPPATLVATPIAVVAHMTALAGLPMLNGGCVLVCDAGAASLELSIVQHTTSSGLNVLATAGYPDTGGNALDNALAQVAARPLIDAEPERWQRLLATDTVDQLRERQALWHAVRAAKHALWQQQQAVVPLPAGHPPTVVDRDALAHACAAVLTPVPERIEHLLAAADIDRSHLTAVVLTGGGARLPGLAEAVAAHTGHSPAIPGRTDNAAADGALRVADPHQAVAFAGPAVVPRIRFRVRDLAIPLVIWIASVLLLWQAITTTRKVMGPHPLTIAAVETKMEIVALAGALAALSALVVAYIGVTAMTTTPPARTGPPQAGPLMRRVYPAAALVGLAMAGVYAMIIPVAIPSRYQDGWIPVGPYLRWSLFGAAFAVTTAVIITIIGPRIPPPALPDWLRSGRPPLAAVLTGCLGVLLITAAGWGSFPASLIGHFNVVARVGAILIAIAVAALLTQRWLLRIAVAVILAVAGVIAYGLTTAEVLRYTLLVAIAWWCTLLIGHTLRAAFPSLNTTIRRWLQPPTPPPI